MSKNTFVKRIPNKNVGINENISYSYKEALVHKICNLSPFLPKTYKVEITNEGHNLTIEMEKLVKEFKTPSDENKVRSWKNILQAVALLNFFGIAHRDIKDENIMYRNGEEAVLIDFGLSKPLLGGFHTPSVVSDFYRAPELDKDLEVQKYSFEIDSWALGIWAVEMWNKNFDARKFCEIWKDAYNNNKQEARDKIEKMISNVPQKLQKVVRSFLLPADQRKVALDWVKIDTGKALFYCPEEDIKVPPVYAEWEKGYKAIYHSLREYFKGSVANNELLLKAMTIWACSLLLFPYNIDIDELAKEHKTTAAIIYGKVLDWFTNWKIMSISKN